MNLRSALSLLLSILLTGLPFVVTTAIFLFFSFNLAGGETIGEVRGERIGLFIFHIIIAILSLRLARRYQQKARKFTSIGIAFTVAVVLVLETGYDVETLFWHSNLNTVAWKQAEAKPLHMALRLYDRRELIGLNLEQVDSLLGPGDNHYYNEATSPTSMEYNVEDGWLLIVVFSQQKVNDIILRQPFLGV